MISYFLKRFVCYECSRRTRRPDHTTEDNIICTHCLTAICTQCLIEKVDELETCCYSQLRCPKCDWMYWPVVRFNNSWERRLAGVIEEILRKQWTQRLLEVLPNEVVEDGEECLLCCERSTGNFVACDICRFPQCGGCFLRNAANGIRSRECPGCRNSLEVLLLLQKLRAIFKGCNVQLGDAGIRLLYVSFIKY